jgi:hypothetical protein
MKKQLLANCPLYQENGRVVTEEIRAVSPDGVSRRAFEPRMIGAGVVVETTGRENASLAEIETPAGTAWVEFHYLADVR